MSEKGTSDRFPERVVLGDGFPWVTGLGNEESPYKSIMMLEKRIGVKPRKLEFPQELWSNKLPRYRLVLERIKRSRGTGKV